jgi:hypothetical protein
MSPIGDIIGGGSQNIELDDYLDPMARSGAWTDPYTEDHVAQIPVVGSILRHIQNTHLAGWCIHLADQDILHIEQFHQLDHSKILSSVVSLLRNQHRQR